MIINGNYEYIDYDRYKKGLIEGFTEYYGEEYRDFIENKINGTNFYSIQDHNYLCDYYNSYIKTFKDEILDNFFKLTKIERNENIEKIIIDKNKEIFHNIFYTACEGEADISKDNFFTNCGKRIIKNARKIIDKTFAVSNEKSCEEKLDFYFFLADNLNNAIDKVEKNHPCDVFDDYRTLKNNYKDNFKQFLIDCYENGYKFSVKDLVFIFSEKSDLNNLQYKLDCSNILYRLFFDTPGYISAFTSSANKILKTGDIYDKADIYITRLLYAGKHGAKFNQFEDNQDLVTLKNNVLSDVDLDRVLNEYEFQKKNFEIKNIDYEIDEKTLRKNIRNGQFFREDLANHIEEMRDYYSKNIYDNCKFKNICSFDDYSYFALMKYDNNHIMAPKNDIFMLEDCLTYNDNFLRNLVHEINHALSHDIPLDLGETKFGKLQYFFEKTGVNYRVKERQQLYNLNNTLFDSNTNDLQENINERQAREILKHVKKYVNIKDDIKYDGILPKNQKFVCIYDFYDCMTEDFYNLFHDELKLQNINPEYNMCFDYNLPITKLDKLISCFTNNFTKYIFRNNSKKLDYYNFGVVDMKKLKELGELVSKFYKEIVPNLPTNITSQDFMNDKNFELVPNHLRKKARLYKNMANIIVNEMYKDKLLADRLNNLACREAFSQINNLEDEFDYFDMNK